VLLVATAGTFVTHFHNLHTSICCTAVLLSPFPFDFLLLQVATDEEQLKGQYEALELQPIPTSPTFVSPSCASAECEPVAHDRYTAQGYRLHSLPAAEVAEGTPLSYKAFREEFLEPRRPVVLRGKAVSQSAK
jgi:hypothetical protein